MPFVITISQQKGGAGKSTLAAHLGIAISRLGHKVTFIDIDPQQTLANWYEIREKNNYAEENKTNFLKVAGWKVSNEIANCSKDEIVIIDSPPHMQTETKSAIRIANLVIVPCQPSPNDIWATSDTIKHIEHEGKNLIMILNRCPPQTKLLKMAEEAFAENIKKFNVGNRVLFASAMMSGLTSFEVDKSSKASKEIEEIASYILSL